MIRSLYVFYKPVEGTEWSVAVVCPYRDVFAPLDRLTLVVVSVFLLGLLALLFFCVWRIRRTSHPLKLFFRGCVPRGERRPGGTAARDSHQR